MSSGARKAERDRAVIKGMRSSIFKTPEYSVSNIGGF